MSCQRYLPGLVLMFATQEPCLAVTATPQTLTFAALDRLLSKQHHVEATFEETHFSTLLSTPLRSRGRLGFTPPTRIEKQVTEPQDELFTADAGKIFIVNNTKGFTKTLNVDDYPALSVFVDSFRAVLGGRIEKLDPYFELQLSGSEGAWHLSARPREANMRQWVQSIEFGGQGPHISRIDIHEANGDHSEMVIDENPQ